MSSRRSRSRQYSGSPRISDDQFNELVSQLQQLLPQRSAGKVLEETCNYLRRLHREVDDLSERLSEYLETIDANQAALIRTLLTQ